MTIYLVSDGRDVISACTEAGIRPFLRRRAAMITRDIEIDMRLDGKDPKAVVRYYASSDSSWLYNYPIRAMEVYGSDQ